MTTLPRLTAGGIKLDTSEAAFGFLRESNYLLGDADALRARMEEDGYLYLPGFLDREGIVEARLKICEALDAEGQLDRNHPILDAIAAPDAKVEFRPDIVGRGEARAALERVIYGPKIMQFYSELLGGEATHYDYTWLRTVAPGKGTYPHCDVVFMGRGTHNLCTAWVPLGDIPINVGGLILVEGSHHDEKMRQGYCALDVDTACENKGGVNPMHEAGFTGFGAIGDDFRAIREGLGRRLLTAREFKMGDLLTFNIFLVHGSLDNGSNVIRMSSDSRYQLASEPIDERWIGENPPGHGGDSVRKLIC